jgi:hypothetical protein
LCGPPPGEVRHLVDHDHDRDPEGIKVGAAAI